MTAVADPAPWVFASCFALSIASALMPWLNGEVLVLSYAVLMPSGWDLAFIALAAAAGQTVGKCVLYWMGTGAERWCRSSNGRVRRWFEWLRGRPARASALVFLSSALSLPPLYATTLAAAAFGMPFLPFISAAAAGRVVRYGAVVLIPNVLMQMWRA